MSKNKFGMQKAPWKEKKNQRPSLGQLNTSHNKQNMKVRISLT